MTRVHRVVKRPHCWLKSAYSRWQPCITGGASADTAEVEPLSFDGRRYATVMITHSYVEDKHFRDKQSQRAGTGE